MSLHRARVEWRLAEGDDFRRGRYSRVHAIDYGHGVTARGSASPAVVPRPFAVDDALDPEAAFVGALSACHMLTFLDLARRDGFMIAAYADAAEGVLEVIAPGRSAVTRVTLRPDIAWTGGTAPSAEQLADLHHRAHELCFIANSVKTEITIAAPAEASTGETP
jgi:organic hydroperoxide reductase OsmC/OhrA